MISNSSTKSRAASEKASTARHGGCSSRPNHSRTLGSGFLEEHMFGAAKADAFAAEFDRGARIVRRIGVDANAQFADFIRPSHQRAEFARQFRFDHRHPPGEHLAQRAVDGDDVAGLEGARTDAHGSATAAAFARLCGPGIRTS